MESPLLQEATQMAQSNLCYPRYPHTQSTTRRTTPNDVVFSYPLIFEIGDFWITVKENSIMFLNMSYSANSCSHSVVSNASTKVTKKSKHPNNYQNMITNSKATFTCASPWHKYHLHLPPNIKINNNGTLRLLTQRR